MRTPRTPFRALMVGWLAAVWHHWLGVIAFPYGGGEAHWVMNRFRPLGFADGLHVGGLTVLAGLSLVIVLKVRRWWVALLVGVAAPALVGGATGALTLGFFGLPIVVIGLLVVLSRVQLGWVGIGVVAWWPGFVHLLQYLRWMGTPEGFRDGVGIMWVGGGLLVGAVARGWGNRLPEGWEKIEWS